MKHLFLFICLSGSVAFADGHLGEDVKQVEKDVVKTATDSMVVLNDLGKCIHSNIPSPGTLIIDGTFDGLIRQIEIIANAIKVLEDKNPVNGAIVRDLSKFLTVLIKWYYKIPVDLSGRLYDGSDIWAAAVKLSSKSCGFGTLYMLGGIESSVLQFLVNNGGDVVAQGVLDSGTQWRKQKNTTESFEDFVLDAYSIRNSMVSIPAKGAVSYSVGWLIQKLSITQAAELATLVLLNQVTRQGTQVSWPKKLSFRAGVPVCAVTSIVKSMFLTTLAKSAVQLVNEQLNGMTISMPSWPAWPFASSPEKKSEEL